MNFTAIVGTDQTSFFSPCCDYVKSTISRNRLFIKIRQTSDRTEEERRFCGKVKSLNLTLFPQIMTKFGSVEIFSLRKYFPEARELAKGVIERTIGQDFTMWKYQYSLNEKITFSEKILPSSRKCSRQ